MSMVRCKRSESSAMQIEFIKSDKGGKAVCERADGTTEIIPLNESIPFHDLAHFVVEKHLKLQNGFFGHLARGYSYNQLSSKEVIKALPQEIMYAEIVTRALQSLSSGGCRLDQFSELVSNELSTSSIELRFTLSDREIAYMLEEYEVLKSNGMGFEWVRVLGSGFQWYFTFDQVLKKCAKPAKC
jgi:hypothetical protein